MLRVHRTAQSRRPLVWMGLVVGAVGILLVVGGCGIVNEDTETTPTAPVEPTPAPTPAVTRLDLPDLALQRSDVPIELEVVGADYESDVEYKVEYGLPDPEASLTGLRSVANAVRLGNASFPSLADVRSLQRHVLDAVEIPDTGNFGDESILYRVTVLADHAEHHIYYGYINQGGLGATVIGVQGTLPDASAEEIADTIGDILLLMQLQEDRLLASGP